MCTHIAIIERGKLLVSGSVADILQAMQPARDIYIRVLGRAGDALRIAQAFPAVISAQSMPAGHKHGQTPAQVRAATPAPAAQTMPILAPYGAPQAVMGGGSHIPPPPMMGNMAPVGNDGPATVYMRVNGDDSLLGAILARLVGEGIPVFAYEEAVSDLEEIFLRTTRGLVQ
jgi:hypothetical protein